MSDAPLAPLLETELTRRDLLRNAIAGALLTVPWIGTAEAAVPPPPQLGFKQNRTKDGIVGPYGEIRLGNANGLMLPFMVIATGGLAVMNFADRKPYVQIGNDDTLITYNSDGISFGKGAGFKAWNRDSIGSLVAAIGKDRRKLRGMLNLRAALQMSYPAALRMMKGTTDKRVATAHKMAASGNGAGWANRDCTTKTVTETVVTTVTEYVEVWKSAERQWQECYDKEVRSATCAPLGSVGAQGCAFAICTAKGFVDVFLGLMEVTRTVLEEVVRTFVVCAVAVRNSWPNPVDVLDNLPVKFALPQDRAAFKPEDIPKAIEFLKGLTGFLGPFGKCLLGGKWSLAQLNLPVAFGDGTVALPYGVKVCVNTKCAKDMSLTNVGGELLASWGAALGALAAMSTAFAAYATSLGIAATPIVVTAVAAAGGAGSAIVSCAALILAFIILALIYGTAIAAQLEFHERYTDSFADGEVCIEHPTFALALIKIATLSLVPSELIPPVVTG